jgi:uncharacterized protein (TIGR00255 family)
VIHSMTGFSTRTVNVLGEPYKIELKSLNHRFLDLKLRIPRSFYAYEAQIKSLVEQKINRGSVEVWIERQNAGKGETLFRVNEALAEGAFKSLNELRHKFQISDEVSLRDIVSFPEVIEKSSNTPELDADTEKLFTTEILKSLQDGIQNLSTMRAQEGSKLRDALLHIISELKNAHGRLLAARSQLQKTAQIKIKKRIEQCFEAYATSDEKLRALMETRIAQEITYAMEKMDIEEELTRFIGHVQQIEALLKAGGLVGKKLDFMFQELNREVNTLGNKAQDLGVSQDVIDLKMKIEQMREQSLNLE